MKQIGGEKIDIVILSLDKERRSKLLSDRFAIGTGVSAAWGNGKSRTVIQAPGFYSSATPMELSPASTSTAPP